MFSVLMVRDEIRSLIIPRLQAALLTVLGHVGPLASGGQKDNSQTHIEIKVVTNYVQVFQRERVREKEKEVLLFIYPISCFSLEETSCGMINH